MKQHTILLVACLMTVPAVAAEDAGPCDDSPCYPSADPTVGPGTELGAPAGLRAFPCNPLEYSVQVRSPPDVHTAFHPECVIRT